MQGSPGWPGVVWEFPKQEIQEVINIYADASWAGCSRTRKSMSGGCAMFGKHFVKAWSRTQSIIAKSSGESELYGVIRGSPEGLDLVTLAGDFGVEFKIEYTRPRLLPRAWSSVEVSRVSATLRSITSGYKNKKPDGCCQYAKPTEVTTRQIS